MVLTDSLLRYHIYHHPELLSIRYALRQSDAGMGPRTGFEGRSTLCCTVPSY
jgi:hypothetical protein